MTIYCNYPMAMTQKLFTLKTDLPILNVTSFAVSFVSFFQVATLSTGVEFGQRQTKPRLGFGTTTQPLS